VELLDVCSSVTDGDHQAPPKAKDGIPFLVIGNMNTGRLNLAASRFVPESYYRALDPTRSPRRGDVLYSVTGSFGIPAPVNTDLPFVVQRHIAIIRPAQPISGELLAYVLATPEVFAQAAQVATGTAQRTVPLGGLRRFRIPIPPQKEQTRLVHALDSYFSRLDDAVATLERVQRNLKRYRASVLKAAVEGRLVPTEAELAREEGRDYEPADVLLTRILEERKSRWIEQEAEKGRARAESKAAKAGKAWTKADDQAALTKDRTTAAKKYKEPDSPETSNLPELPEGWCWATVDQFSIDVRYGSSAKTSSALEDGVPVLRMGNIVEGRIDFGVLKYLPQDHEEFPDLLLQSGDLVFNRTNSAELVGKTAVYRRSDLTCSLASYLIRVRVGECILPEYVSFFINSLAGRRWIASVVSQQVGQANVNGTKLKGCVVPLPPAAEQVRIVQEAERLLSISFAVEKVVLMNIDRSERLRQSILKWAFEGKLVDQDPNDEPASVLLDRIKAEREAAEAAAKAKKKPGRTKRKKKPA